MDNLIIPENKRTGCLPRKSKFGEVCDLLADRIDILDQDKWGEFIGKVTSSQWVNQILDQDGVGSCATESTTQGDMQIRAYNGLSFELLNPWFIYYHTSGGRDNGSNIDTNLEFARDKGIAPESVWPRSKGWRAKPSREAYAAALNYRLDEFFDIGTVREVGSALCFGFPVVFGWQGHSCVLCDLLSETTARYANSWGDWGDKGFGTIRLSSINFAYGAFAVRSVVFTE